MRKVLPESASRLHQAGWVLALPAANHLSNSGTFEGAEGIDNDRSQ